MMKHKHQPPKSQARRSPKPPDLVIRPPHFENRAVFHSPMTIRGRISRYSPSAGWGPIQFAKAAIGDIYKGLPSPNIRQKILIDTVRRHLAGDPDYRAAVGDERAAKTSDSTIKRALRELKHGK
jgi:hypothetical protein